MGALVNPSRFGVAGPTDPLFANVASLLHFDGADGSTSFVDVTGKTWTQIGTDAVNATAQSKFGGASFRVGGGVQAYIDCTDSGLAIGTADFTMEAWVYRDTSGAACILWDQRPSLTNGLYPAVYHDASGNLHYFVNNADAIAGSSGGLTINTWAHVELSRASGSTKMFVDGLQHGSTYADSNTYLFGRMRLGANSYDSNTGTNFSGYMDDFRLTIGAARHTANFTPPTAPFPNS